MQGIVHVHVHVDIATMDIYMYVKEGSMKYMYIEISWNVTYIYMYMCINPIANLASSQVISYCAPLFSGCLSSESTDFSLELNSGPVPGNPVHLGHPDQNQFLHSYLCLRASIHTHVHVSPIEHMVVNLGTCTNHPPTGISTLQPTS